MTKKTISFEDQFGNVICEVLEGAPVGGRSRDALALAYMVSNRLYARWRGRRIQIVRLLSVLIAELEAGTFTGLQFVRVPGL